MGTYTQTIKELLASGETVFPTTYPFYSTDAQLKSTFEELFKQHFYLNEIGFEDLDNFKQRFYAKMLLKNDYYKQLYETQVRVLEVDFMLNKDLKETTTLNASQNHNGTVKNTGTIEDTGNSTNSTNSTITNTDNTTVTDTTDFKESNIENGLASLNDTNLTNISNNVNSNVTAGNTSAVTNEDISNNSSNTTTNDLTMTNNLEDSSNSTQTLISKGNIGVTSSAELLNKWRDSLINLNEMIINDCYDLFMLVY